MIKSIPITDSRWLSRIEELLKGKSVTLDSASQTHWFNLVCKLISSQTGYSWNLQGNDLITFDQDDTWKKKEDFANNHCFGGTFIW